MRKILITIFIVALAAIFASCSMIVVNEERDMAQTVIKVDDSIVTKGEFYTEFVNLAQYYIYYFGFTFDEVMEDTIDSFVTNEILKARAQEYGCYEFTQEDLDIIQADYDEIIESYRDTAKSTVEGDEANQDKSQEELDALAQEYLDEVLLSIGFDEAAYMSYFEDTRAIEKLEDIITQVDDPTDEELESAYNEKVNAQQLEYNQDLSAYESAISGSSTIYYYLPDTRKVKHVLIKIPDEVQNTIQELRDAGDEVSADVLFDQELANIKETADTVYSLAMEGTDFDELIAEYGEDDGMADGSSYYAVKDGTTYVSEFTNGLFSLENVGDISQPISSGFGYHIILFEDELPEGAVSFESVKDEISEEIVSAEQSELYSAKLAEWQEAAEVKVYKSRLNLTAEDLGLS